MTDSLCRKRKLADSFIPCFKNVSGRVECGAEAILDEIDTI